MMGLKQNSEGWMGANRSSFPKKRTPFEDAESIREFKKVHFQPISRLCINYSAKAKNTDFDD